MSAPVATAPEMVLVRYGELGLKGGNRPAFEAALQRNIASALARVAEARVERSRGRMAVFPTRRVESVARRLQEVFGISSISPAWGAPSEPEAIVRVARLVLEDALAGLPGEGPVTFRVRTSRGDKRFPLTSMELDRFVAERILVDLPRIRVQLKDPELTLGIDVRSERTYVFASRLPGPGGLPVGTLGRAVCLISGGIDSPVAAWMAMKRGCEALFVTFHSPPYIGESARKKVVDLVRVLARWQPRSRLWVVPFAPVQLAVCDAGRERYRTVLYRRMMQRIATRFAHQQRAVCLVTGESLGQVASQTAENLRCIAAVTDLPVLRPLIAFDKHETIALARRIGTFELSARREPDCCTLFMPDRPVLRGRLEECEEAEARIDVERLVAEAAAAAEVLEVEAEP